MTKRSDGKFKRNARDLYMTPAEAVIPLTPFLRQHRTFAEPFVGDGAIVRALEGLGYECAYACDIEPLGDAKRYAETLDAMTVNIQLVGIDCVVTNSPWPAKFQKGEPTVGYIRHFMHMKPSFFLLSADVAHNGYMAELLLNNCTMIQSVGRVKWIADSENTGFDNAAWYGFGRQKKTPGPPPFYPRGTLPRAVPSRGSLEDLV